MDDKERVLDWQGGDLTIVGVIEGPTGPFTSEPIEHGTYVPLGNSGFALPSPLIVPLTTREGEPVAELEIGVVDGRPACVAIRAQDGYELTTLLLRQLPGLRKIVQAAAAPRIVRVVRTDRGLVGERHVDAPGFMDARQELRAEAEAMTQPRRKRRVLDEDFLQQVAAIYREADAKGIPRHREIQKKWPTSSANARRWVSLARKEGHLGPAPEGRRPGELSEREEEDES
jgi:hypothetical protein